MLNARKKEEVISLFKLCNGNGYIYSAVHVIHLAKNLKRNHQGHVSCIQKCTESSGTKTITYMGRKPTLSVQL